MILHLSLAAPSTCAKQTMSNCIRSLTNTKRITKNWNKLLPQSHRNYKAKTKSINSWGLPKTLGINRSNMQIWKWRNFKMKLRSCKQLLILNNMRLIKKIERLWIFRQKYSKLEQSYKQLLNPSIVINRKSHYYNKNQKNLNNKTSP